VQQVSGPGYGTNAQHGIGAGDVNGDGFDDVIIGAPHVVPNGNYSGSSFVLFGKASGFKAIIDLSSLDSNSGFRLDAAVDDNSGRSVSSAGDVNGDGFDDVIVGASRADPNGISSGSSYVIFGRSNFGSGNVIEGTPGDDDLKGTSVAEIFQAGDGDDSMVGRGGADVFHGDAGDDNILPVTFLYSEPRSMEIVFDFLSSILVREICVLPSVSFEAETDTA